MLDVPSRSSRPRDDKPVTGAYVCSQETLTLGDVELVSTYLGQDIIGEEIGAVDELGRPHFSALLFDGDVARLEWRRHHLWLLRFDPGSASLTVLARSQRDIRHGQSKGKHTAFSFLLLDKLNSSTGLTSPHNAHVISVRWPGVCSRHVMPVLAGSMPCRPPIGRWMNRCCWFWENSSRGFHSPPTTQRNLGGQVSVMTTINESIRTLSVCLAGSP